jgi:hypothetical protein
MLRDLGFVISLKASGLPDGRATCSCPLVYICLLDSRDVKDEQ